jgi:hypothetical protein
MCFACLRASTAKQYSPQNAVLLGRAQIPFFSFITGSNPMSVEKANGDPREAATLGEACSNGDGTYNGLRLLSWLSHAVSGRKGLSEDNVKEIWKQVKRKASCDITDESEK